MLIPDTPSEASFTAAEASIQGSQFGGADSPSAVNSKSIPQSDLPASSRERGFSPFETSTFGSSSQVTSSAEISSAAASERGFVEATTFEEPFQSSSTALNSSLSDASFDLSSMEPACRWIEQYLVSSNPDPTGLSYWPVSLVELLRQPVAVNQRSEMIVQYWETWSQWAELNSRIQFAGWVSSIPATGAQGESQFLATSKQQAENQVLEAKTFLSNAQSKLQSYMQQVPTSTAATQQLPLPSDIPLIHPYVSNFQLYQKYRSMPQQFQNIDRDLQDTLNQIVKQTQTVESAKLNAESQVNRYQSGQSNLSSVVAAGQTWRMAEMNLIRTVAQYNQTIANYSLNVTDGRHAPETVAAMLIGKSGNKRALAGRQRKPDSRFQSAQATRSAEPFRQNGSATQLSNQRFESGSVANESPAPFPGGASRSLRDEAALSPDAAQFGDRSSRSQPGQNNTESNFTRFSGDNSLKISAQPIPGSDAGATGDFRPASRLSDPNSTGLSSGLTRPEKFNPLKPLANQIKPEEAKPSGMFNAGGSANPDTSNPDTSNPGGSNPGIFSPSESNLGGSVPGGSNPSRSADSANGLFRPSDFNPSSRTPAEDTSRSPSSEFSALPGENNDSKPILPPENMTEGGENTTEAGENMFDSGEKQDP